jgi:hypothetical protein
MEYVCMLSFVVWAGIRGIEEEGLYLVEPIP